VTLNHFASIKKNVRFLLFECRAMCSLGEVELLASFMKTIHYASNVDNTDFILDIDGYYAPQSGITCRCAAYELG
jgi:hypothetical protein